jgi:hypothetical protein
MYEGEVVSHHELIVLEVVELSDGRWDTRHLDFEFYSRSRVLLDPNILHVLRDFERQGLAVSVPLEGGTGPGWRLTPEGRRLLRRRSREDQAFGKEPADAILIQEVEDQTAVLRRSPGFAVLREQLVGQGIDVDRCLVGGLLETEDLEVFGAVVAADLSIHYFETDGAQSITEWRRVSDESELRSKFQSIGVAMSLMMADVA